VALVKTHFFGLGLSGVQTFLIAMPVPGRGTGLFLYRVVNRVFGMHKKTRVDPRVTKANIGDPPPRQYAWMTDKRLYLKQHKASAFSLAYSARLFQNRTRRRVATNIGNTIWPLRAKVRGFSRAIFSTALWCTPTAASSADRSIIRLIARRF